MVLDGELGNLEGIKREEPEMTNNDYNAIQNAAAEFMNTIRKISDNLEAQSQKATGMGMHQKGWELRVESDELALFMKDFQELLANAGY